MISEQAVHIYDEPDVSENNRGSQGLDEGDRVAFTAQGWLPQAW
jgi:hypothetical protein